MKAVNSVTDYLTNAYLVGLSVAVGAVAAVTAVLLLWPPMAYLASKLF